VLGDLARRPPLAGHQHDLSAIDQATLGRSGARPLLQPGRSSATISIRFACAAIAACIVTESGRHGSSPTPADAFDAKQFAGATTRLS